MCDTNNYNYYKQHHICVKCGQEDAERNHTLCLNCLIKAREYSLVYYYKHIEEQREKGRIKNKIRYEKLKNQGICTACGKRQTKNNKVHCEYCSAKENERKRNKYLLYVYETKNLAEIRV